MKKIRKLLLSVFSISVMASVVLFGGCNLLNGGEQESEGPQFLKGIDKEIELGDGLEVDAYIKRVADSAYTVTIRKGEYFIDITKSRYWEPEEPGVYTVTYTVEEGEFAGSNSFELTVTAPRLTWEYTLVNTVYDTGYELSFEEYFNAMNIAAKSYYPWKMVMDSVTVNDITTDLTNQTSWTFTQGDPHVFKFHIETEDGQIYALSQLVEVRYIDEDMVAWMESNNVTVDGALRLASGQNVVLEGGAHTKNDTAHPDELNKPITRTLPYLSFNNEYGIGDYVVFEFTGNNMPYMLFFGDEITNTVYWDENATEAQNKGFLIANGWTTNKGLPVNAWHTETHMNARLCLYGPNKAYQLSFDQDGFIRATHALRPHPMSMYTLTQEQNENRKYRVIAGFSKGTETQLTFEMYVIDMTNMLEVDTYSFNLTNTSNIYNNKSGEITFTEDMFKGKIALYGQFGKALTIDKLYGVEEDTTLQALKTKYFSPSKFLQDAPTSVGVGVVVNVFDYIAPASGAAWKLQLTDPDGNVTQVSSSTIAFTKAGEYTLLYSDGVNANSSIKVQVADIPANMYQWMQTNNVSFYHLSSISADKKTVLAAGTHSREATKAPDYGVGHDMAYIAYNGNYGIGDFVVVDFTGNNMPTLSFFNGEVTNSIFYDPNATAAQNKGLIISNGMMDITGVPVPSWNKTGSINDRIQFVGPTKAYWLGETVSGWFRRDISANSPLGVYTLAQEENANKQYRLIAGFSAGSATGCTIELYVIDRQTGEQVLSVSKTVSQAFAEDAFSGSIVLYGQFGKALTLDTLYAIEEDTTIAALKTKYAVNG